MIKYFPEVELFFNREAFTQEELDLFIESINFLYQDKNINKKVHSIINLRKLKFHLQLNEGTKQINNLKSVKPSQNSVKHPSNKSETVKENEDQWIRNKMTQLKSSTIKQCAEVLNLRPSLIVRMLARKGYKFDVDDYIDSSAFSTFIDYAVSRTKMLYRQKRKNEELSSGYKVHRKSNSSNAPGVYGRISTYGPGKII